jgi:hypothetical protein
VSWMGHPAIAKAAAGPSTHHPQAEERLGPLSLRMTELFLIWRDTRITR